MCLEDQCLSIASLVDVASPWPRRVRAVDQLASMLQVVILLASLAIWGMILERLTTGEPLVSRPVPATRPRPWFAILLTVTLIFISCYSQYHHSRNALPIRKFDVDKILLFMASQIGEQMLFFCLLLVSLTRLGEQRLTRFGMDLRQWGGQLEIGLFGGLAAMIPVVLANYSMLEFRVEENQHIFLQIFKSERSLSLAGLLIVSAVIMAPLGEELMYRVILQGTLQRYLSPTASIVISASLFSAVHGFPDAVGLLPLALILGFLYWRTGSYLTVVTTHAAFNGVTVLLTLMSPEGK